MRKAARTRSTARTDAFGDVSPRSFARGLALVAVGGLALRVAYVVWRRDWVVLGDGFHYHRAALRIADGDGFINPLVLELTGKRVADAVHPPAWTLLLTGWTYLGQRSTLAHQLFTCAIGTATIVMTGLAGRAALSPRAGLVAAGLVALYPGIWFYERELLSEPLAMLVVATTIWLAYRFRARPSAGLAAALGFAVGAGAMTRSELLLASVLVVLPLVVSVRSVPAARRFGWLCLAGAVCVACIAPWAIYNATRFDNPVPLSTGLGPTMRAGNCDRTYEGELLGYYEFGCLVAPESKLTNDASVADSYYRTVAVDFMRDHASDVPIVSAARLGRTFQLFRPAHQAVLESERGSSPTANRVAFAGWYVLLPFAIGGAMLARRLRVPLYPLLAYVAIVVLATATTIGTIRYRAPAEIPLVILAGGAIAALVGVWERHRASSAPASPPEAPGARQHAAVGAGRP